MIWRWLRNLRVQVANATLSEQLVIVGFENQVVRNASPVTKCHYIRSSRLVLKRNLQPPLLLILLGRREIRQPLLSIHHKLEMIARPCRGDVDHLDAANGLGKIGKEFLDLIFRLLQELRIEIVAALLRVDRQGKDL